MWRHISVIITITVVLVTLLGIANVSSGQIIKEWVARYDAGDFDCAYCLEIDYNGDIFVAGTSDVIPGYSDNLNCVLIKYNSEGVQQWSSGFEGPGAGDDIPKAMVLDQEGNIYLTGDTDFDPGDDTIFGFFVIKYDPNGDSLWVRTMKSPENDDDHVVDIAVDGDGNAFVAANYHHPYYYDILTLKYDSAGDPQWSAFYDGGYNRDDNAAAITVDPLGNVYVAGDCANSGSDDLVIIKYDNAGVEQWVGIHDGSDTNDDGANDVAVDQDYNVYVGGYAREVGNNDDFVLIKYDSNGNEQWITTYNGPLNNNDEIKYMAVDTENNIIVSGDAFFEGTVVPPTHKNIVTIKYDPDGSELWTAIYDGSMHDLVEGLALDQDNNVYITGRVEDIFWLSSNFHYDYLTLKYNGTTGEQSWSMIYSGYWDGWDIPEAIAVDAEDNVYVTGGSINYAENKDYVTIKYGPPSVSITLTPYGSPIQIPWTGGSFEYNIGVENNEPQPNMVDIWTMAILPNAVVYGPIINISDLTIAGYTSLNRDRTQAVPGGAPAGIYTYIGFVGEYPDSLWDADTLQFEKLLSGDGTWIEEWASDGEVFQEPSANATITIIPAGYFISQNHPNPFNPVTTLRFQLPEANLVSLAVYDVGGRKVTDLVDGWREAGTHEVVFDGSELASGLYIYRLEAGSYSASGKMVLMR